MPAKVKTQCLASQQYGTLPFTEAIDFIKGKIDLPTATWSDITNEMHGKAFVVAGAMKQQIVADFHEAVTKAIETGTDIAEFRKDFDKIVKKHGWTYNGTRGWRSAIILDTNLSTAYSAGREKQRRVPAVLKAFPNDRYETMDDSKVRPLHSSWNGVTLPANDPWWETHTPPNGWRCRCYKTPTADTADTASPENGAVDWKNPSTGITEKIPAGIDPGFAYNPADAMDMSDHATWQSVKKAPEFVQEAFLEEMAKGNQYKGVLDTMVDKIDQEEPDAWHSKGISKTIGWIQPAVWKSIKSKAIEPYSPVITATDIGVMHAIRTNKSASQKLTAAEIKQIPEIIANPEAVLWDSESPGLLYCVASGEKETKIVIKLEQSVKRFKHPINTFATAGNIEVSKLKTKRYEVISGDLK